MNQNLMLRCTCIIIAVLLVACGRQVSPTPSAPTLAPTEPPTVESTATALPVPTAQIVAPQVVRTLTGDPHPLKQPIDAAVDSAGNLFVLDAGNSQVQEFDSEGKFVTVWGSAGNGDGQFSLLDSKTGNGVGGIAVDQQGTVYVADAFNSRVQKFDRSGDFVGQWGSKGEADGQFLRPSGIDVDATGNVYVYDVYADVIQKFTPDGQLVAKFGAKGGGNKRNDPGYLAVSPQGLIYECDAQLSQVEVYGPDGQAISSWKLPWGPTGIALDTKGHVFITLPRSNEAGVNQHVWEFDSQGNLMLQFAGTNNTMGIAIDSNDLIYLVEEGTSVVQVLKLP